MSDDWTRAAAWAALVTRWLAAQVVLKRLELVQKLVLIAAGVGTAVAAVCVYASTRYEPDWPWLAVAVLLVLAGLVTLGALRTLMWVVRRLALSRRARPLAGALASSRDRMLAELQSAGVPVSIMSGLGFLWALARGRQPHRGISSRFRAVVARSDEVLDLPSLRATLDDAARRAPRGPVSR